MVVGLITYRVGFGLKQSQRSVMALGMSSRNISAVLAALWPFRTRPADVS